MDETTEPKTAAREKAEAHLASARQFYVNQKMAGAVAECQKAVDTDPSFQIAQDYLRHTRQEKEEIEEEILKMRAKIDALAYDLMTDENLRERNELARLCYLVGQNEEARAEWEWVVRYGTGNAQESARKRLWQYLQIMPITVAILAGGESRRMGTDKAGLEIGGMTLLERTARLALAVNLPVLVMGRARPDNWPLPEVSFLADAEAGLGPVGGLATALRHSQTAVLALACDLPLLMPDAVQWLISQAKLQFAPSGLVALNSGQQEPLFSVYDVSCLPLIEARLAAGQHSLRGVIKAGNFAFADAPDWVGAALANANTPEDWAKIGTYHGET